MSVYLMCFYIPEFTAIVEMFFTLISLNDSYVQYCKLLTVHLGGLCYSLYTCEALCYCTLVRRCVTHCTLVRLCYSLYTCEALCYSLYTC